MTTEFNEFYKRVSKKHAEELFEDRFERDMKGGNINEFKKTHYTLYEMIIDLTSDLVYENIQMQLIKNNY